MIRIETPWVGLLLLGQLISVTSAMDSALPNCTSVWRPFTKNPLPVCKMQPEIFMSRGKVRQAHIAPGQHFFGFNNF